VIDGTGAPQYRADVAVANGKIAEIGKITDGAKKVIDAAALMVAPGFIDPHTHYDAQICWDPLITSSSWHGVTSLVMPARGVEYTIVNGAVLYEHGKHTGALPGQVLRSGAA